MDDKKVYNGYVKMTECCDNALRKMPSSMQNAENSVAGIYEQIDREYTGVDTNRINSPENTDDGNELFYSVLYRLNLSTDIESCKKSAAMLKDYLSNNPDSVMGSTMLKIIREQFED